MKIKIVESLEFIGMIAGVTVIVIAYCIADIIDRIKYGKDYEFYREEF